jgi:hypothetical protein
MHADRAAPGQALVVSRNGVWCDVRALSARELQGFMDELARATNGDNPPSHCGAGGLINGVWEVLGDHVPPAAYDGRCVLIERTAQQPIADGIAISPRPVHCMLRAWV